MLIHNSLLWTLLWCFTHGNIITKHIWKLSSSLLLHYDWFWYWGLLNDDYSTRLAIGVMHSALNFTFSVLISLGGTLSRLFWQAWGSHSAKSTPQLEIYLCRAPYPQGAIAIYTLYSPFVFYQILSIQDVYVVTRFSLQWRLSWINSCYIT